MTLALGALVAAGGIIIIVGTLAHVARLLVVWRRRAAKPPETRAGRAGSADRKDRDDKTAKADKADQDEESQPPNDSLDAFVCHLGDVVIRRFEGDEAWLAGALLFAEDRPVAVLFIAPEAHGDRAILVPGPAPATMLTWLAPLPPGKLALTGMAGEPPPSLEHEGVRFERTRRLPVRVRRLGSGAPHVGAQAIVGEYEGRGGERAERLVVVAGTETTMAWRGVPLAEGQYDVLPGNGETE